MTGAPAEFMYAERIALVSAQLTRPARVRRGPRPDHRSAARPSPMVGSAPGGQRRTN